MVTKIGSVRRIAGLAVLLCALASAATATRADDPPPAQPSEPGHWSLGDVVSAAIANNPAVGQADAEVRAATARRKQAAAAALPQVGASAGWSRSEVTAPPGGSRTHTSVASVQGTVAQLLTDFGRTGATVARSGDLAAAAAAGARFSRVEVAFSAAVAYFNVLRAANLQGIRGETVRQRELLLRQAQAFFDAGLKARIDVVRAEANLYQARADAVGADHDLRVARLILLNRMGVDGPADFELADAPDNVEAAGSIEGWLHEADEKHPDLAALRLQLSAADNARLAAGRGHNPSLTASGRLGWSGTDELPEDRGWSIGAQLTVPVFNGFLTSQQAAEADARVTAAEYALADRRRQIRLQVEQADQAMREAAERLAAREKEREASAENLRLATGRYEAGAADIIEMIDAQVQMASAETNLAQTKFDRGTALAALYRSLGRLPLSDR